MKLHNYLLTLLSFISMPVFSEGLIDELIIDNEIDVMLGRNLILGSSTFEDAADSGFGLNANFRHYLSDQWSAGLSYHYLDFSDVDTKDHALYLISSYEMNYKEFIPYATGGLGVVKVSNDPSSYTKIGLHGSLGVRKYLNKNVKLNVALNFHHVPENNDMNNAQTLISPMIGFTFFFGREKPEMKKPMAVPVEIKKDEDKDDDGDGIDNNNDQCPNTPKGTPVNYLGCEKDKTVSISLDVKFELESARINPGYVDDLDRLAKVMKKHPDLKIEVQGHTDSTGRESFNMKMSNKRARSVAEYLLKNHFIDESRIKAKGYGPRVPIASNKSLEGRKKNRRVEAKLMIR